MVCARFECYKGLIFQKFSNKNLYVCVCLEDLQVGIRDCACGSMPVLCDEK